MHTNVQTISSGAFMHICMHILGKTCLCCIGRICLNLCMKISPKNLYTEPWMNGPDLARHYGVDPATIRRWRREGMPSHPRGYRLVLYKLSECEAWLKTRRVPA